MRSSNAIGGLVEASKALRPVFIVGAPLRRNNRLYNCAVVISRGKLLGVVPKSFLPNYREYYENRWFAPGAGVTGLEITVAGRPGALRHRPHLRGPRPGRLPSSTSRSARTSGRRHLASIQRLRSPARSSCATSRRPTP